MKLDTFFSFIVTFLSFSLVSAIRLIESKSLNPCQDNSNFTATLFNVVFTPDNHSLAFEVVGVSSIEGKVTADLEVIAYGFTAMKETLNPCKPSLKLGGLCPMTQGEINIESNVDIPPDVISKIPGALMSHEYPL